MSRKKKVKNYTKERKTLYFCGVPLTIEKFLFALYIISIIIAVFIVYYKINPEEPDELMLFALCYLCFCAYTYHKYKLDEKQNLHEKVAWISKRYYGHLCPPHLRDRELYKYIEVEQRVQNIPPQYRIDFSNETEKECLKQILNKHKSHVVEYYFYDRLKTKDIYNLKSLEYYFFSLSCFVFDKLSNFKDDDIYEKEVRISSHEFRYQLSEYGRVYYKLELIVQSYVENNNKVRKLFEYIDKKRKNIIMEILDTNEEQIFK